MLCVVTSYPGCNAGALQPERWWKWAATEVPLGEEGFSLLYEVLTQLREIDR